MAFNEDNLLRLLQILGVSAALIMAVVTGIKYLHRRVMKDVEDYLQPSFKRIEDDNIEQARRISLLEQAYSFVKEFFMKARANANSKNKTGDSDIDG